MIANMERYRYRKVSEGDYQEYHARPWLHEPHARPERKVLGVDVLRTPQKQGVVNRFSISHG